MGWDFRHSVSGFPPCREGTASSLLSQCIEPCTRLGQSTDVDPLMHGGKPHCVQESPTLPYLLSLAVSVVRVSALCTSSSPQQQLATNTAGQTRNSQHLYNYALTCHMSLLFDVLCHYQSTTQDCSSACSPPLAATVHTASYAYPEWPLLLARRVPSTALSLPRE